MTEPHPDAPDGYYICYEDTDSRVMPWYEYRRGVDGPPPFETELEATQALLVYFEEMYKDAARCIRDTTEELARLQQCQT